MRCILMAIPLLLPVALSGCSSLTGAHYDIESVDGCMVRIKATGIKKGDQDTWQFDDDCTVIVNGEKITK